MSPQKKKNSMDFESKGTGLKFSCKKCGKSLTTEHHRKIHFQFHCPYGPAKTGERRNPDDSLVCFNCKHVFRTVKILRRHLIRDCKMEKRYRCQLCDYKAYWACRYQGHMSTAHPELMEVLHDVTMGTRNQENQTETGNEEYEPETGGEEDQLETGNVEEQLEAGNEDDQLVTGNTEDQLETGDEEDQPVPENVNRENQLITKPKKVKQHTNVLKKSNTLPKFDFTRPIKQNKKLNKSKNNKSGNETAKGVKSGKENKGGKQTREEKENDYRKKIKTENEKKVENERSYQKNDLGIKEGEENEEAGAMVPVIDLSLDQWLEGLPTMSEEEFETLKAIEHIIQF